MIYSIIIPVSILIISSCSGGSSIGNERVMVEVEGDTITVLRGAKIGADSFNVEYAYNDGSYTEPLVGRSKYDSASNSHEPDTAAYRLNRHYEATISVYIVDNGSKKLIGGKFFGQYVPAGCFEDRPDIYVRRAKYLQSVIDSNEVLRKKNGEYALYKYVVTWRELDTGLDSGGLTITEVKMSRDFRTNKECHDFINGQLWHIWSGIDFKMDSVLIEKRFKKPMTSEEYQLIK